MSTTAMILILTSCVMHAGWNLLGRRHKTHVVLFFFRHNLFISAAGFLPAVIYQFQTRAMGVSDFIFCAVTGFLLSIFYYLLGKCYETADMSSVYPLSRAFPILLLLAYDAARGFIPSPLGMTGMVLVVFGCFLAPIARWSDIRWKTYFNRSTLMIVFAALTLTSFTINDKIASESDCAMTGGFKYAILYGYFYFITSTAGLWLWIRLFRLPTDGVERIGWRDPAISSLTDYASYVLILYAYQIVASASYVTAFRQFGIVIGVFFALFFFKEPGWKIRLPAAAIVTVGLALIGLANG